MSIIYDALQKIERKPQENTILAVSATVVHRENVSVTNSVQKKSRSVVLKGLILCFLLLLSIYFLRMQPVSRPLAAATTKITTAPVQQQYAITDVSPVVSLTGNNLFPTQSTGAHQKSAPYVLQGVIYDEVNPLALINGKKVGLGERIGDAVVLDISSNGVELLVNEEKIFLPLD